MANYCRNYVTFKHSDPLLVTNLRKSLEDEGAGLFSFFAPLPSITERDEWWASEGESLTAINDRIKLEVLRNDEQTWKFSNWGTSCEAEFCEIDDEIGDSPFDDNEDYDDERMLTTLFYTKWSPPIGVYERASNSGWLVDAVFIEEGERLLGQFRNKALVWRDEEWHLVERVLRAFYKR